MLSPRSQVDKATAKVDDLKSSLTSKVGVAYPHPPSTHTRMHARTHCMCKGVLSCVGVVSTLSCSVAHAHACLHPEASTQATI